LNSNDPELALWCRLCRAPVIAPVDSKTLPRLCVPGAHNRSNAATAAAMAQAFAVDDRMIATALGQFTGLPHRLKLVAEIAGRHFFNDSKSTSPAATLAALAAMDRFSWLLLGGADQRTDYLYLATKMVRCVKGAGLFGAVGDRLVRVIRDANPTLPLHRGETMSEALTWCWRHSQPGDAILLSPGCASTDQFRDFAQRGEEFERLVRALH
jgi:UDP-N-acetylmuramoylalanine--D-glutamate ligase